VAAELPYVSQSPAERDTEAASQRIMTAVTTGYLLASLFLAATFFSRDCRTPAPAHVEEPPPLDETSDATR
jgi:hypothetical protein